MIDVQTESSFYRWISRGRIGGGDVDKNRFGFTWKVRTQINREWGLWSPVRTFDVEPVDTDPPETPPVIVGNLAPNPSFEVGTVLPTGWVSQGRNTDARFLRESRFSYSGNYSVGILASKPGGAGWPGWETEEAIPIDPGRQYEFTAYYYVPDNGLMWMDVEIFDSSGRPRGSVSARASPIPPVRNAWLFQRLLLDPMAIKTTFPDIAKVKLGLRLSLQYELGIPQNTITGIYYDNIHFGPSP